MFDLTTYVKKWQIRQLKTVFSTLDTLWGWAAKLPPFISSLLTPEKNIGKNCIEWNSLPSSILEKWVTKMGAVFGRLHLIFFNLRVFNFAPPPTCHVLISQRTPHHIRLSFYFEGKFIFLAIVLNLLLDGSLLKNICRPNYPHGLYNTIALAWVWRQHFWKLNHCSAPLQWKFNHDSSLRRSVARHAKPSKRSPNQIRASQYLQSLFKWWHPLVMTCTPLLLSVIRGDQIMNTNTIRFQKFN